MESHLKPLKKSIRDILTSVYEKDYYTVPIEEELVAQEDNPWEIEEKIKKLEKEMKQAANELAFEKAAVFKR